MHQYQYYPAQQYPMYTGYPSYYYEQPYTPTQAFQQPSASPKPSVVTTPAQPISTGKKAAVEQTPRLAVKTQDDTHYDGTKTRADAHQPRGGAYAKPPRNSSTDTASTDTDKLADIRPWSKQQLLDAYEAERRKHAFSHRHFCRQMNISESTFASYRNNHSASSPISEKAIREFLLHGFPSVASVSLSPSNNTPAVPAAEPASNIEPIDLSGLDNWDKSHLLAAYETKKTQKGFSHRFFCQQMGLKESTFATYRNKPGAASSLSEKALRAFLKDGFPIAESQHGDGLPTPFNELNTQHCVLQLDKWLQQPLPKLEDSAQSQQFDDDDDEQIERKALPRRAVVLVDGDNSDTTLFALSALMPPADKAFLVIFARRGRYHDINRLWQGRENVIVRSALSDDKNATDIALAMEAMRLAAVYWNAGASMIKNDDQDTASLTTSDTELVLVSNDTFVRVVRQQLQQFNVRTTVVDGHYHHLGMFLARRLGYGAELIEKLDTFQTANKLCKALDLIEHPAKNWKDLQQRAQTGDVIDLLNMTPGMLKFVLGELHDRLAIETHTDI